MSLAGVVRFLAGTVCTAAAAGPTLVAIWLVADMPFGYHPYDGVAFVVSAPVGFLIALPAALANAIMLTFLAREGADSLPVSLLSGALTGVLVHAIKPRISDFLHGTAVAHAPPSPDLATNAVFALAGAIMGLLYWLIAIRPQRVARLSAPLDELSAPHRKSARRVPWDGRLR
jgi:hypothetical protein